MTTEEIIETEELYQLKTYKKMPIALVRGEGSKVWDASGKEYFDFYGGHCVMPLGHCPAPVVEAISHQAGEMMFYSNVVYSPVRARTAALLASLMPDGLRHVFFCNSGTEANETALKLARKFTGRPGVIAMEGGFHGRTLGSLAATWGPKYRQPYSAVLPETHFVPFGKIVPIEELLTERDDIAAILLEPIQSMAGIIEADLAYYHALRDLCSKHGVMLIFDEVQTGVGRCGTFSVADTLGVTPDLVTMAKSLGSGVPVGAVFVSDEIAADSKYGDQGTTFGGGMLAMAAVEATVRAILDQRAMAHTRTVFQRIKEGVAAYTKDVRGRGCLIGLEIDQPAAPVLARLLEGGIIAGGADLPNVIRLMPPLNVSDEAIDRFISVFKEALQAVS